MIREIEIDKLNAAEYNPRVTLEPGMPEYEKLKKSIEDFGNVLPIVWNERTGNVIGGHQRLTVLKEMGYKTVPCSVMDLDERDEKILNIALNKIKGQWDYDKLEQVLREFDYEVATSSGFSADELAVLLASNDDLNDDGENYLDWDERDGEQEAVGGSYVITLVFANAEFAAAWTEKEGYEGQIREGSTSTIIRIDE